MQVDGELPLPAGDDDDSLFGGSPPSSPTRGRSPKLALPTGPGSAENVGTIALPGSHYCSELAIDPAVLVLNSPPPSRNSDSPSTTPRLTPPSALNRSSHKPLSSCLLGHAGLIGGLDPSALSRRYHKRETSQNAIIVEDELDPPLLGKKSTSFNPSSLPSPSNDEVISSLVKQRNIFPVLESLLGLFSGTSVPSAALGPTPSGPGHSGPSSSESSQERGPPPKRRRLNSVPAGAADWDVPYPFQQGEGPNQYRLHWEKERLKQLLSQLAVLIKGAKRSAAARTYLQQHAGSRSATPSLPQPPSYQQHPEPRASLHDTPTCHPEIRDVIPAASISENTPHPAPQVPATIPQIASLDDLIASLYNNSIPPVSSPFDFTSSSPVSEFNPHHPSPSSSYNPSSDALPQDLDQFLAMLHHTSSQCMTSSIDSPEVSVPPEPLSKIADQVPPHEIPAVTNAITDSVIDPTLLGESPNHISDAAGQVPSTPTLLQSPIASASSVFDPLTPREDLCSEPDVYRPEQGTSRTSSRRVHIPQGLVNAITEDPISAASLLLQMAIAASSQASQAKARSLPSPASRYVSVEPQSSMPVSSFQLLTISTPTTTPTSSRASSAAPRPGLPASKLSLLDQRRLNQVPPIKKALNKQELIRRAKERRQQLLAELEKAKGDRHDSPP
ncbi:hypothetical protein BGW80DRAFT_1312965 [Lactifluus volemus]|nr:hypothetical protein BGW80DRAFT_1312965 [Lactifluus volemus]